MKAKDIFCLAVLVAITAVLSLSGFWLSDLIKEASTSTSPSSSEEPVESILPEENSVPSGPEVGTEQIDSMTSLAEVADMYGVNEAYLRVLCKIAIQAEEDGEEAVLGKMCVAINLANRWYAGDIMGVYYSYFDDSEIYDEIILYQDYRWALKKAVDLLLDKIQDPTNGALYYANFRKMGYKTIGGFLNDHPVGEYRVLGNYVFIRYIPESF